MALITERELTSLNALRTGVSRGNLHTPHHGLDRLNRELAAGDFRQLFAGEANDSERTRRRSTARAIITLPWPRAIILSRPSRCYGLTRPRCISDQ